jgi:hypothetical protein
VLEQHLLADADTEEGFAGGSIDHRLAQAALVQLAHAVRHRTLAGHDDTLGRRQHRRIGGDDDRPAAGDVLELVMTKAGTATTLVNAVAWAVME